MTNIIIKGKLGKLVGENHSFFCHTLKDVFDALECNTGKFKKYLLLNKKRMFAIFINDKPVDIDFLSHENVKDKTVVILPVLFGAVGFTIAAALGTAFFATGTGFTTLGFITAGIINAAFSFGLSMLISSLLAPDDPKSISTSSFVFGGPENVSEQGGCVPVGYGRLMVGGKIVSVNSFSVDRSVFDDEDFYNTITKTNASLSQNNLSFVDEGGSSFN